MPDKIFLETYPLYRWFEGCPWHDLRYVDKPRINLVWSACKSLQTFAMTNNYWDSGTADVDGRVQQAAYRCQGCGQGAYNFLIEFDKRGNRIRKVGQVPPWRISIDPALEEKLGEFADLYRKALILESQSYGIGAFAYYRRIVEENIDDLLNEIPSLMSGDELALYSAGLARTRETRVTNEKIELVKELLPAILRPNEMNPLSILHETLSEGLHARTDEECMALAQSTREVLVFLVNQLRSHMEASKSFTVGMRKLLEKRVPSKSHDKTSDLR